MSIAKGIDVKYEVMRLVRRAAAEVVVVVERTD